MTYDRAQLVRELIRDENEKLRVYRCTAGKLTIGVGRNLGDVGISAAETKALGITRASVIANGITVAQSRVLLGNDIDACEAALDRRLPWWRRLDPVRQRVLLNMCFNLGLTRLLGFRNTLRSMETGDYAAAARGMALSKWAGQVKGRAIRLISMMLEGKVA